MLSEHGPNIPGMAAGIVTHTGSENCRLPGWNRLRPPRGWVEPEVWFRIVHAAVRGQNGAPVATYCRNTENNLASSRGSGLDIHIFTSMGFVTPY